MGSLHNDLATWAGRAKARGQDRIEIDVETAFAIADALTAPPERPTPLDRGEVRETIARIIDPSSWRVMDAYLTDAIRACKGRNASYDPDAFKHKESLARADAILAILSLSRLPVGPSDCSPAGFPAEAGSPSCEAANEPATPSEGSSDRIEVRRGVLDEIVLTGMAHLEQMSPISYYLGLYRPDGGGYQVWLTATKKGRLEANWEELEPHPKASQPSPTTDGKAGCASAQEPTNPNPHHTPTTEEGR